MKWILAFLLIPLHGFSQNSDNFPFPVIDHEKNKLYEIEYKSLETVDFLGYFSFNLPDVKPIKTSDSTLLFKTDSFKIIIEEVAVDTNLYKYEFNKIKNEDQINGKKIYGTDWSQPKTRLSNLVIEWKNRMVQIPDSVYSQLYNPSIIRNNSGCRVNVDKLKRLFLSISGSDGAGSYDAIIVIHDGVFYKRYIGGPP
tara:strand:- start:1736 stop:2326 length:591 start_codon:yes stop_codon:yes gene_type:complete